MSAAAVTPERPRNFREFGMARFFAEVDETLLERFRTAIARVAPHLAIGFLGLFVRRREQRTSMLLGERLPMQIVGTREPRLARPLAAPVLVDDDPREPWFMSYSHDAKVIGETLNIVEDAVRQVFGGKSTPLRRAA